MDKEYIERGALIEELNKVPAHFESGDIRYAIAIAKGVTLEQPAAEVVEVVRCKDCEHRNNIECAEGFCWCEKTNSGVTDNHFCSYGTRKED